MTMNKRNIDIAINVLKGKTFEETGKQFGLTRERARQITCSVIKEVDHELIAKIRCSSPGRRKGLSAADEMRSHAERLIPLIITNINKLT